MVITILAEPRSGSTNLTNWFYLNKNFTTLFNPDIPPEHRSSLTTNWYQNGVPPKDYKYNTEHLLIKEDYYHYKDYSEFIKISDKIICLYRKNEAEQIESWINAKQTNNWSKKWAYFKNNFKLEETEANFFKELKESFRQKHLNQSTYFKISYEELYYENGFQKIVDYLQLECVKNENFPIGEKYRINIDGVRNLI
jgi:LPS sulfotransferase NodH